MLHSTVYVGDAGEGSIVANPLARIWGRTGKAGSCLLSSGRDGDNEGLENWK